MIIENEIKTRFIQLIVVDSELLSYPSYRLSIQLKTEEITAKFDRSIWVSEADVQRFIQQLEALTLGPVHNVISGLSADNG